MTSPVFGAMLPAALLSFALGAAAACSSSPPIHPLADGGSGAETTSSVGSTSSTTTSSSTTSSGTGGAGGSCAGEVKCATVASCPSLGTSCLEATCAGGCCGTLKVAAGTICTDDGGKVCDGKGACVACQSASQCPATGTTCAQPACTAAGACTPTNASKGTTCNDNGGKACDGMGHCTSMHCEDGLLDADETDIDCGGADCAPCTDGLGCKVGTDCVDKVCNGSPLTCQAPTCSDGVQNGTESDKDCGGSCPTKCVNQEKCAKNTDCVSMSCISNVCAAATCSDGILSPGESDVDCGGTVCPACVDGKSCHTGTDCVDKICGTSGTCSAATCMDNTQNGGETDTDCGGPTTCPRCSPGKKCGSGTDCAGGSCQSGTCQCPSGMVVAPIQGNGGIYCIDATEVSYGQYQAFYDANPLTSTQPSYCTWNVGWTPTGNWPQGPTASSNPVSFVNWCQAAAFCAYEGRRLCGSITQVGGNPHVAPASFNNFHEDQWFNACTAQGINSYPYGSGYNATACNGGAALTAPESPNLLINCIGGETGLFEMSGNVAEWEDGCAAYGGMTDGCPVRGGSYNDDATHLRCDSGQSTGPITQPRSYAGADVGFRCCL